MNKNTNYYSFWLPHFTYHKYHGYYKSCGNIDSFRSDILHLYLDRVPQLNKAELKESYELEA